MRMKKNLMALHFNKLHSRDYFSNTKKLKKKFDFWKKIKIEKFFFLLKKIWKKFKLKEKRKKCWWIFLEVWKKWKNRNEKWEWQKKTWWLSISINYTAGITFPTPKNWKKNLIFENKIKIEKFFFLLKKIWKKFENEKNKKCW